MVFKILMFIEVNPMNDFLFFYLKKILTSYYPTNSERKILYNEVGQLMYWLLTNGHWICVAVGDNVFNI